MVWNGFNDFKNSLTMTSILIDRKYLNISSYYLENVVYLGCTELYPVPAVPRQPVVDGGRSAGGLATLHPQGPGHQGGEGQPHVQVR